MMHLAYSPKFGITIVFDFSWDECNAQEKLEMIDVKFCQVTKVHYGLCENGESFQNINFTSTKN